MLAGLVPGQDRGRLVLPAWVEGVVPAEKQQKSVGIGKSKLAVGILAIDWRECLIMPCLQPPLKANSVSSESVDYRMGWPEVLSDGFDLAEKAVVFFR